MSQLAKMKAATSLKEFAHLLGYKPKSLSYILYKKPAGSKYSAFEIPKRTGGVRIINAPADDLKKLQQRLATLLQDSMDEIDKILAPKMALSHGFRRNHSIITNAAVHRNKRYVFNLDLEEFFPTINFGRVRGFFIKNKNFELDLAIATVLAQIACHNNALPQGSPCSPVISNLVAHILDVRLAQLAKKTGCRYSRYADDLTFSTNDQNFPTKIAERVGGEEDQWQVGGELNRLITKAGFIINPTKTRMQFEISRQDVTGLIVNKKVNTRTEYRHMVRAMTHRLLATGEFFHTVKTLDDAGELVVTKVEGTLNQLNGMLSFIDSVSVFNTTKLLANKKRKGEKPIKLGSKKAFELVPPDSRDNLYSDFLFYRHFYANEKPTIVFEGKTDNIYIRAAVRKLAKDFQNLVKKKKGKSPELKVDLYRFTKTSARLLHLGGGTGDLSILIRKYKNFCEKIGAPGMKHPVIMLVDNDEGASGGGGVYNAIAQATNNKKPDGKKPDGKKPFYFVCHNLYVVPTPLKSGGEKTTIEDFFESSVLKEKLNGKIFNRSNRGGDNKTEYGKATFATQIVRKHQETINFDGFKPILKRIEEALEDYAKERKP